MKIQSHIDKLSPSLRQWCQKATADSERTVLIRLGNSTNAAKTAGALRHRGVKVESVGAGTIVAKINPLNLQDVEHLQGVQAVEEPQIRFTRRPPSGGLI